MRSSLLTTLTVRAMGVGTLEITLLAGYYGLDSRKIHVACTRECNLPLYRYQERSSPLEIVLQATLETAQECPSGATTTDDAAAVVVAMREESQKIDTTQETPKGSLDIDADLTTGEQTSSSSLSSSSLSSGRNMDYLSRNLASENTSSAGYSTLPLSSSSLHPETETLAQHHRQHCRDDSANSKLFAGPIQESKDYYKLQK
ncbi:hypothetical protein BGX20_006857 [Mortierella sp. AD010]|nr:hypothetical protein BGX20_006857 [Mortierella sp. AD010]